MNAEFRSCERLGKENRKLGGRLIIAKSAGSILSFLLANTFNTSIALESYPTKLKHVKVIPVYKEGDETDPDNY